MAGYRHLRKHCRSLVEADDVFRTIYEAAAKPSAWTEALRSVVEALDVSGALLVVTDPEAPAPRVEAYATAPDSALSSLQSAATVGAVLQATTARSVGAVFHWDPARPRAEQARPYAAFGTVVRRRDEGAAVLLCLTSPGRPALDERRRRLLAQLAPHLARALAMEGALARAQHKRAALREAFERIRFGVLVLDDRRRLLACNRTAEQVPELVEEPPRQGRRGRLCPTARRRLEQAEARGRLATDAVRALTIPRAWGREPLRVLLAPLRDSADQPTSTVAFIEDPSLPHHVRMELFTRLHALTPAQARLATLLVEGRSLAEIAVTLGLSIHTVRARIKDIFARTGTNSQAQLIRLLLMGPATLSPNVGEMRRKTLERP